MDVLDKYLMEYKDSGFDWNGSTCIHFSAKWVALMESKDPLQVFPELPTTLEGFREFIATHGEFKDLVSKALGRYPVSAAMARRGDLVLALASSAEDGVGALLGICNGSTAVFLREGSGIIALRMRHVSFAWRISQC